MDNSCIIAQFHLDKLSVSVWFHFRAHFSVAYHRNLERRSTLANVARRLKVSKAGKRWDDDDSGSTVTANFPKLAALTQLFVYPYPSITREDEVSYRPRMLSTPSADTRWTCKTIHHRGSLVLLPLITRFPSWVSPSRKATWAHLPPNLPWTLEKWPESIQDKRSFLTPFIPNKSLIPKVMISFIHCTQSNGAHYPAVNIILFLSM